MKFKDKYNIAPEFESLFSFKSKEEELKHEATMIMFRFFSELEKLNDNPIVKKELAKKLNTSPSYITQLFSGEKLINLTMLAKIQEVFDITFEIKAAANAENYSKIVEEDRSYSTMKQHHNFLQPLKLVYTFPVYGNNTQKLRIKDPVKISA